MQDAGYDVRDYKKVAARYGTAEDLESVFRHAHELGMHILLDLVPGHTSEQHAWFRASQSAEATPYDDRYVWTDNAFNKPSGYHWICGRTDRNGCALINFFDMQPALNYGFGKVTEPWQMSWEDPHVAPTFEAILDVMRFWLSKGCDGFRVDMADSLVKQDEGKEATSALWRKAQDMLAKEFPEAVMVAEWSNPEQSLCKAHYQGDFYLNHGSEFGGGYRTLMRDGEKSYFRKDGTGDLSRFLTEYTHRYEAGKNDGYICMITGNHDTHRAAENLSADELKMAYSLLLTLPGVPFVYAGDEIGMRHLPLASKEGGYERTGCRTPMQWGEGKNHGFSSSDTPYLPVDDAPDAPTVAAQEKDVHSLLNYVKSLLTLRNTHADLQADAPFETVYTGERGYPFVYRRGKLLLALNASGKKQTIPQSIAAPLFVHGEGKPGANGTELDAQSFVVWEE